MAFINFGMSNTLEEAKASTNKAKLFFPTDSHAIVINGKEYGGVTTNMLNSAMGDVEKDVEDVQEDVNTLRSELNAAQLELGAVQTDAVPTQNSSKHLTSGAVYTALQKVTENEITNNDTNPSILPNKLYKLGTRSSLNVSLIAGEVGIVNEYMFEFTVDGDEFTLTLPSSVKWIEEPVFEDGYKYQVSIVNNLAVTAGWEVE